VYAAGGVRFLVTGEVSVSWREEERGRRVHLLLLLPSIRAAEAVSKSLSRMGAVRSDGRPSLRASAKDVVDAIWAEAPKTVVIPAHVWTPWYSVFGARSGFDALDACFGPYAERITAIETGLSSDPAMCRRVSALDRLTLVSFSDAHSPERLGREATILRLDEISFPAVASALTGGAGCAGTIELFPEEGKYYHDGHRACGVCLSPDQARGLGGSLSVVRQAPDDGCAPSSGAACRSTPSGRRAAVHEGHAPRRNRAAGVGVERRLESGVVEGCRARGRVRLGSCRS
jgi:PHP family Zn ribbon phosphoesterase